MAELKKLTEPVYVLKLNQQEIDFLSSLLGALEFQGNPHRDVSSGIWESINRENNANYIIESFGIKVTNE